VVCGTRWFSFETVSVNVNGAKVRNNGGVGGFGLREALVQFQNSFAFGSKLFDRKPHVKARQR